MKYNDLLSEEQLDEVRMNPSTLRKWASSEEADGIRAGFEAEMIFRDTQRDGNDEENEPDYDYDSRPDDIENVIDFFSNDDYGYGLTGRGAINLRDTLYEEFAEWRDEQIQEKWNEEEEDQVTDYYETNIWGDDDDRESRIIVKIEDLFPDDDAEDILTAGRKAPRFTKSSDQQSYVDENELYRKYKEASDAAYEEMQQEIQNSIESHDDTWQNAYEYYRDMMAEGGDYDEADFLRDRYGYMSDIADSHSLDWPYWSGGNSNGGSRSPEEIGNELESIVDGQVRVSGGYHSVTRRENLWIIEPDGSLDPDDYEDSGLEIVSPPMPLLKAVEMLERVIEWGNSDAVAAYTNDSTGLHMGVSLPFVGGDVDYVKLILFLGDRHILEKFGRISNHYCESALDKIQRNIRRARETGQIQEARFDPMGALELMKSNLIELAHTYVQNGVGTSKYTSAHIQNNYIEFRSPGGDYLSMANRGELDDIKDTMLRFARAMYIAGHPHLERREYAKKLTKLIGTGAEQNDALKLFAEYSAGTIAPEELKRRWADAVLKKEIPSTGKTEYEIYDMSNKNSPDGVIETIHASDYDEAHDIFSKKYPGDPRNLDLRLKRPWFDVKDQYGDIILSVRDTDINRAREQVQYQYGDKLSDDWEVYPHLEKSTEPEKKLSPRAQVAKRIKEPKANPTIAKDNEKDSQQIQARIGQPQPAGGSRDTGYYRVTWTERRRNEMIDDALNVDAPNANAAMDRVRSALQAQGREPLSIEANPQEPPAWRRPQQIAVPGSTQDLAQQRAQGGFTGAWRVVNRAGNEVYRFSGVGNNQADANRTAQTWLISRGDELENQGPFDVLPVMS